MFVVWYESVFPCHLSFWEGCHGRVEWSGVVEIGSEWEGVRIGAKKIGGGIGKERGGRGKGKGKRKGGS